MSQEELKRLLTQFEQGEIILLDVREPQEWKEAHIEGAYLFPLSQIHKGELPTDLPPNKPIYIHCRAGARAQEASTLLKGELSSIHPLIHSFTQICEAGFPLNTKQQDS